jgi:hypothetical protein
MIILVLVSCTIIPFQLAFGIGPGGLGGVMVYAIDAIFIADIGLNLRTGYRHAGTVFPLDAVASIPFDLLVWAVMGFAPEVAGLILALRMPRMLRIVRLVMILRRWEFSGVINLGYFRIARLVIIFVLLIHWIACAWFLGPRLNSFPSDSWVTREGLVDATPATQYVRSLYGTIVTVTTVGYSDITPVRREEYVTSMVVMILGASMYAFLIGNIASLLSSVNAAKAHFWNRSAVVATVLERGDCSGQMSLVRGERRTASARSRDCCDLFALRHADFERIRSEYLEFRAALKRVAADRTEKVSSMLMDGIVL